MSKRTQRDGEKNSQPEDKASNKKRDVKAEQKTLNQFVGKNPPGANAGDNTVTIWHWNVNGLRSVMNSNKLVQFVKQANVGILCLNETKIDDQLIKKDKIKEKLDSLFPQQYQHYNCSNEKKGYAGSAILVNPNICGVQPVKVTTDIGISKHDHEGRVTTAEFESFILVAVYVPNAGVDGLKRLDYRVKEWDRDFFKYLKDLEVNNNKPVIVCGDLNVAHNEIDIYGPKGKERRAGFTIEERTSFGKFLKEAKFIDTFRHLHPNEVKYSYFNIRSGAKQKYQGWRLDYFCVSEFMMDAVVESNIANEYNGSDHDPLFLTIDLSKLGGNVQRKGKQEERKQEDDKVDVKQQAVPSNKPQAGGKSEPVEKIKKQSEKKAEQFDKID